MLFGMVPKVATSLALYCRCEEGFYKAIFSQYHFILTGTEKDGRVLFPQNKAYTIDQGT